MKIFESGSEEVFGVRNRRSHEPAFVYKSKHLQGGLFR